MNATIQHRFRFPEALGWNSKGRVELNEEERLHPGGEGWET